MLRDMFQFKLVAFFIIEFQCQRYVSESSKPVLPNDIELCNANNSHKFLIARLARNDPRNNY